MKMKINPVIRKISFSHQSIDRMTKYITKKCVKSAHPFYQSKWTGGFDFAIFPISPQEIRRKDKPTLSANFVK